MGFFEGNQAAFCGKCIKASTQEAPPFLLRPRGATVARLTPDQKVGVFKSRRGQVISYWREMSNMNGLFLSGDTKSEENGNVNAKVKTISFEPESNQRSKDSQHFIHSALLYQLRYRRWENLKPQQLTKKFRKPNLLRFLREIGLRLW